MLPFAYLSLSCCYLCCLVAVLLGRISRCNLRFRRCFIGVFVIALFVPLLLPYYGIIAVLQGSAFTATLLVRIFCYLAIRLLVFCLVKVFYFTAQFALLLLSC